MSRPWPLFQHAQGQTPGFRAFADNARGTGFEAVLDRGVQAAESQSHLFADSSLGDYDEAAAAKLKERVLAFLQNAG